MKKLPNYYKTLQVDPSADAEVIQSAYRKLASKYHPDNNPSDNATQKMQEINEAKEVLLNPEKRKEYDMTFHDFYGGKTPQAQNVSKTKSRQKINSKLNSLGAIAGALVVIVILLIVFLKSSASTPLSPIESNTPISSSTPSPAPTQPVCRAISFEPTPIPGVNSLFPAIRPGEWVKGPPDAAATIIIYNDFQCIECNDRVLSVLAEAHPKEVRLVYRHYPLPDRYDKAYLAAQAAEAAGKQDRFWEMHDALFTKQMQWISMTPDQFISWVIQEAESLGLDRVRFEADFKDAETRSKVEKAEAEAKAAGIPVLPLVLINGEIYYGPTDFSAFDQVVRLLALGKRQFSECPKMTIDPAKQYLATLETEKGTIVIELYADKAPLTVNSFIFLARQGWYDGVTFHRVIPGFVAQAGDPSGTGVGGPGYLFRNEIHPSLHFDKPGMVGMANSGADTNGSQFFITFAPQPSLDGAYTIFGHVISGMDVLAKLTPRDPSKDAALSEGDIILRVTIEER